MVKLLKVLVLLVVLAMAMSVLWVFAALHWSYSEGERAGYVQKFSHKGWLCKTWEGELAMVSLPGTAPEIFAFTVRDETVAAEIQRTMGERAVVRYEEHRGLPTSCFGETNHFVVSVHPPAGAATPP